MDAIQIYGGNCLHGQVRIQGSKNAVLPILAAALLIDGVCEIENCPAISDVYHMLRLMESLCCTIDRNGHTVRVDAAGVSRCDMPPDSVGVMRSSIMLLGALLARTGSVSMQYPGGCVIGSRPIDLHLEGLRKMGVVIREREDGFDAETKGLTGAVHRLPIVSVGATENLVLAAVLANGNTVIENAAKEPEITALCDFLIKAGAKIEGVGTKRLCIRALYADEGGERGRGFHGGRHRRKQRRDCRYLYRKESHASRTHNGMLSRISDGFTVRFSGSDDAGGRGRSPGRNDF